MEKMATANPQLEEIRELAYKRVREGLETKEADDIFKGALALISSYARLRQSDVHFGGLVYATCKDFAMDKEQLKNYIKASMPQAMQPMIIEKKLRQLAKNV